MEVFHSTAAVKKRADTMRQGRGTIKRAFGDFGAFLGTGTERVQVNPEQLRITMFNATRGFERAVIQKMLADVVDCGLDISIVFKDEQVKLSPSDQEIVEIKWPLFVRYALQSLMSTGLVVVQASGRNSKYTSPRVVPFDYVSVFFTSNGKEDMSFWVEDNRTNEVLDCLVFVRSRPNPDGTLASAGSSVMDVQDELDNIRANHAYVDYNNAHKTWVFGLNSKREGRPEPAVHDQFMAGEVEQRAERFLDAANWRELSQMEKLSRAADRSRTQLMDSLQNDPSQTPLPPGVTHLPPWANKFFMPLDQQLIDAPQLQYNPHYLNEMEAAHQTIMRAYNVPSSIMEVGGNGSREVSAQSNMAYMQWVFTVRALQAALHMLVVESFMFVNKSMLESYVHLFAGLALKQREKIIGKAVKKLEKKAASKSKPKSDQTDMDVDTSNPDTSFNQKDMDTFMGNEDADSETKPEPKPEKKSSPKPTPKNANSDYELDKEAKIEKDDNGDMIIGDTAESIERAARLLMWGKDDVERDVRANIHLSVSFRNRPALTIAEGREMYEAQLISKDTFAALCSDVTGLPIDKMIVGLEESLKDAQERRKLQDILEPPEPKAEAKPAPKPAAKPKAKAAAKPTPKPKAESSESKSESKSSPSKSESKPKSDSSGEKSAPESKSSGDKESASSKTQSKPKSKSKSKSDKGDDGGDDDGGGDDNAPVTKMDLRKAIEEIMAAQGAAKSDKSDKPTSPAAKAKSKDKDDKPDKDDEDEGSKASRKRRKAKKNKD